VPHLVADELARRGEPVRHLLSWDDYDRLRKVPAGVDPSFAQHIGRPLTAVPDPCGEHESWAAHFKAPFRAALHDLAVDVVEVSQTLMYTGGAYSAQVEHAMAHRADIDAVLGRYRTRKAEPDEAGEASGSDYYPYKPWCAVCGRDTTTVTSYDPRTTQVAYRCDCGHVPDPRPVAETPGKLVWKVDWPMRWAYETVDFEAGGVDHSSPGSSFTVGSHLVREVFRGEPPTYLGYSFVGVSGQAKMSGSVGGAPTPTDALEVLEPALLRWLYARRKPSQAFTIAFDQEINRTYDEWDALGRAVAAGTAAQLPALARDRAARTASRALRQPERLVPFRTLASLADVTGGDEAQILRILGDLTPQDPIRELWRTEPRLSCARSWMLRHVPPEERTEVRSSPDDELLSALRPAQREALELLVGGLADDWSLEGLTNLLYGVPKRQLGLPLDVQPTPELKAAQRQWFVLLYRLLVGRDTGPRLPTLLLALGPDRVRLLLGGGRPQPDAA
ncbi:MAG TPA: lysine--tRNA ligase, partial [Dermatophilaceae bacterium]|nr:lysine--tRNA ligase [Dermatophilaceae bacterium]